ncbi:dienelactone hydrolase family protein [Legionella oakridgensis]|uniref:Dienelactone hydrolase-related enzyme n=2 Tax=Legionella oakridgensis TaxID=29423 RepID=W0BBA8_9GAMM|nr:dienelactone hydrolase family protein [Legionella oakridgensis]AHE65709.1 dienelactone hydrolase-related enzyme [Legionella oakridgensis ATCC 33761 = DSM 21215]KTD38214.1 Dienelactone hydrolase family protein [Legionella oakridgensis]STY15656.1 Dienelactone hydrolase family [Legionella longbeachae]
MIKSVWGCIIVFSIFFPSLIMAENRLAKTATALTETESVLFSSQPISLPPGVKQVSIPFLTANLDDFSALLGQSPLPTPKIKSSLLGYLPNKRARGVVIISPSSEGVRDALIGEHIRNFLKISYAVIVVDSYSIRGTTEVLHNQARVSFPAQVLDILLAIKKIQNMKQFAPLPIGLFGASRGAMAITLALDKRLFNTLAINAHIRWACVLYPLANLYYDLADIQPVQLPFLSIVAEKDDEVSPKQAIDYAHSIKEKNPQMQLMIWPDAVHLFDAPFAKIWLPDANSALHTPIVLIDDKGHFIFHEKSISNWSAVVALWKEYETKGIHIGHTNNSNRKVLAVIKNFVNKN